jgi:hypothetical protein
MIYRSIEQILHKMKTGLCVEVPLIILEGRRNRAPRVLFN